MKLKTSLAMLCSLVSLALFAKGEPLAIGAPAPALKAADQDGKEVDLQKVYAKGPTLVYFYPKADTPGCTKQACSLRDEWTRLQEKGVQVLGVSGDKPEALKAFQEKYKLPFTLVSDPDSKLAEAFGVPRKGAIASRQSFLIKNGKIAWNMLKASTATHAEDVLKAYQELAQK
ncbi:MAG: peroxiredoxin [Verrucomicrobiota bacterium]|nr:peroxiredoxin [Verrucomicrobiota bacterium]